MTRGVKTPAYKKELVKSLLCLDPDMSKLSISKQTGIPDATVHGIINEFGFMDKDKFEGIREENKKRFIGEAWVIINKVLEAANIKMDRFLADPKLLDKTRLTDLTLSIAQLYDKQAMAAGEPSIIVEHNENIRELVISYEATLSEIKQIMGHD